MTSELTFNVPADKMPTRDELVESYQGDPTLALNIRYFSTPTPANRWLGVCAVQAVATFLDPDALCHVHISEGADLTLVQHALAEILEHLPEQWAMHTKAQERAGTLLELPDRAPDTESTPRGD
ncbi:MAG: hypothetical protein WD206_07245 [Actinomycetota bacterium]